MATTSGQWQAFVCARQCGVVDSEKSLIRSCKSGWELGREFEITEEPKIKIKKKKKKKKKTATVVRAARRRRIGKRLKPARQTKLITVPSQVQNFVISTVSCKASGKLCIHDTTSLQTPIGIC